MHVKYINCNSISYRRFLIWEVCNCLSVQSCMTRVNMLIDLCSHFGGFELNWQSPTFNQLYALNSFVSQKMLLVYQLYIIMICIPNFNVFSATYLVPRWGSVICSREVKGLPLFSRQHVCATLPIIISPCTVKVIFLRYLKAKIGFIMVRRTTSCSPNRYKSENSAWDRGARFTT